MIGLLQAILCALKQIPYAIIWAVIEAVNAVVVALGALLAGLAAVLPGFPALPAVPTEMRTVLSWVAWVFPVSTLIAILVWVAGIWLAWFGISIVLRWAKVLSD